MILITLEKTETVVKTAFQIVTDHGITFTLATLVTLALFFSGLLVYRYYSHKIDTWKVKHPYGLKNHMYFHKMGYMIKITIPTLPIDEPLRREIFRDFLDIKFRVFKKVFEEFINNGDIESLPQPDFQCKLQNAIVLGIQTYEQEARDRNIPEIVITKFNEWHKDTIASTETFIGNVTNSPWYSTNSQRLVAVLDFLVIAFHNTLLDAYTTLINLNGDLDVITYKGLTSTRKNTLINENTDTHHNAT